MVSLKSEVIEMFEQDSGEEPLSESFLKTNSVLVFSLSCHFVLLKDFPSRLGGEKTTIACI